MSFYRGQEMPPLDDIIMGRTEPLLAHGFPDGIPGMVKFLSDYPAQLEMLTQAGIVRGSPNYP